MPSPIEDVISTYAKSLEFHSLFCQILREIQSEETRKIGIWAHVWIIPGNLCENKDFCSKILEIQDNISSKKVWKSNLLYRGEGIFFSGIAHSSMFVWKVPIMIKSIILSSSSSMCLSYFISHSQVYWH